MSKLEMLNLNGEKVKEIKINDKVWGIEPNDAVLHNAIVLAMANRKTLLKQGKARTELSALWASKGSIINKVDSNTGELIYKELAEFLYTQGIDPNSTDLTKIIQGESVNLNNKGPLKGYFDMIFELIEI